MSVLKRPNGSYQVTVCYGGRTHRKSSRRWSFQDAREFERKWQAAADQAAAGREPRRLIADAIERWLTEHVSRLKSARQTRNHARALLPFIAGKPLSEAPTAWAEVKAALATLEPATVNQKGAILRQVCNLAYAEWGWLDQPIGQKIKLLPVANARQVYLSRKQVHALARSASSRAAADYILLAAYTGIRRGHMLRLTRADVRGASLALDLSGKTPRAQLVPLHKRVLAIAKRLPLAINANGLREAWDAARKATGMTHVRWHDLRHTYASWLIQAGAPLIGVKELLGHSTVAMTQRYAHLANADLAKMVRRVK